MLRFFPFSENFDAGMGGRVLKENEPVCDIEPEKYSNQIQLKRQLLDEVPGYYFTCGLENLPAQWDVLELLLENLAAAYPLFFKLEKSGTNWRWHNALLHEEFRFCFGDPSSLPLEPLDWVGRQVQEDLMLLSPDTEHRFFAGQLCFPNLWSITEALGKTFLQIHAPTPQATMQSVFVGNKLLDGLKIGRTIWRMSWNFKLSDQLDHTPRSRQTYMAEFATRAANLCSETVGQEVFIRIERQTFTRLPRSNTILFGIHTYISSLEEEAANPIRARRILNTIVEAPRHVKDYKAITPIETVVSAYLQTKTGSSMPG
jgi:dimethylamine monooxygenase subunit A